MPPNMNMDLPDRDRRPADRAEGPPRQRSVRWSSPRSCTANRARAPSASLCHGCAIRGRRKYAANQARESPPRHRLRNTSRRAGQAAAGRPGAQQSPHRDGSSPVWKKLVRHADAGRRPRHGGLSPPSTPYGPRPAAGWKLMQLTSDRQTAFHRKFGKIWAIAPSHLLSEGERNLIEDWAAQVSGPTLQSSAARNRRSRSMQVRHRLAVGGRARSPKPSRRRARPRAAGIRPRSSRPHPTLLRGRISSPTAPAMCMRPSVDMAELRTESDRMIGDEHRRERASSISRSTARAGFWSLAARRQDVSGALDDNGRRRRPRRRRSGLWTRPPWPAHLAQRQNTKGSAMRIGIAAGRGSR